MEREGGGGVDTNTRVVGGEILAPAPSQENDQHHGDTGDNLNNIYNALSPWSSLCSMVFISPVRTSLTIFRNIVPSHN